LPKHTEIISPSNERVKYVRRLQQRTARYRERRFVIEGSRLVEEALRAGVSPAFAFFTPAFEQTERGRALVTRLHLAGVEVVPVTERVLAAATDTVTPQGILAVVPLQERAAPPDPSLILLLDRLADPGNLGTILRSAEAAGVDLVMLAPGTVDAYSPKVVRAGMGAHFRLSLITAEDWGQVSTYLDKRAVWLAEAGRGRPYYAVDWTRPSALIIGGEAEGASEQATSLATGHIHIPMRGPVESLNAAMAASVILFEALRQRAT